MSSAPMVMLTGLNDVTRLGPNFIYAFIPN